MGLVIYGESLFFCTWEDEPFIVQKVWQFSSSQNEFVERLSLEAGEVFAGEGGRGRDNKYASFSTGFFKKGFKENGHFEKKPNDNEQKFPLKRNFNLQLLLTVTIRAWSEV